MRAGPVRVIASQHAEVGPGLRHVELYTPEGLLTVLWHGAERGAEAAVVTCGGGMGSLLGPANAMYHRLGEALAPDGVATLRVGYRVPNDLDLCLLDVAAAVQMALDDGARRAVVVGHSFGGAVAVRAAVAMPGAVAGVVTLATQSAGCEVAAGIGGRPLLLLHGEADELLPAACSEVVREIAGAGELVLLPGAGHLLTQAAGEVRDRVLAFVRDVLAA